MYMQQAPTGYYRRAPIADSESLNRLQTACVRFGIRPPALLAELADALSQERTAKQVARGAVEAGLTTDDPRRWAGQAVEALSRAMAVDRLKVEFEAFRREARTIRAVHAEQHASVAAELNRAAEKAISSLTDAAARLPIGSDPLDPKRCLDEDAGAARRAATDALRDLSILAAVTLTPRHLGGLPPRVAQVAPIVDCEEVDVERVDSLYRAPLDPADPRRTGVRALIRDLDDVGMDAVLTRVARGEYAGVSLRWAGTSAEVPQRLDRFRRANSQRAIEAEPDQIPGIRTVMA